MFKIPPEVTARRQKDEGPVNEALVGMADELMLVHWYDFGESSELALSGGLKNKMPFESQCIAVGLTTGEPATSRLEGNWDHQYVWTLPVKNGWSLEMLRAMKAPSNDSGGHTIIGSFYQLPPLLVKPGIVNQHGSQEFCNLPWSEFDDNPTNSGGTHLSLDKAESLNYHPMGETETNDERAAQILVGAEKVLPWLRENLDTYFTPQQIEELLIPDIYRITQFDWSELAEAA